jgi:hypothetical protein
VACKLVYRKPSFLTAIASFLLPFSLVFVTVCGSDMSLHGSDRPLTLRFRLVRATPCILQCVSRI